MAHSVIVTTKQGKLKGIVQKDIRNNTYHAFKGIPYAQPPLGKLRFRAPQKMLPWIGVRDATIEGDVCIQSTPSSTKIIGSENCLFLNVYTPNIKVNDNDKLRPVMFWIHGGLNLEGSGNSFVYGPDYLIAEDVVLVTINYRLGILGFLALDDPNLKVPGNAAFKDMVLALKWVQENITVFGGDPGNVTVFGQSAGSSNAHVLMCSPTTKGLFHKVIAQSGCATNVWAVGSKYAKEFMNMLGFQNLDDKEIFNILQNMPADQLIQSQRKLEYLIIALPATIRKVGPVAEIPIPGEEAFLSDDPVNILKSGNYNRLPMMIGYNNREGIFFEYCIRYDETILERMKKVDWVVPHYFEKNKIPREQLGQKILNHYMNKSNKSDQEKLYDLGTDASFIFGIYSSIDIHITTNHEQLYVYKVSVESDLNMSKKIIGIETEGVTHGDDLGYLFKMKYSPHIKPNSLEDISQRRFAKLWTTFARYGNPNPPEKDPLIPVYWKPAEKTSYNVLEIGKNLTLLDNPEKQGLDVWRNLLLLAPKL